MGAEMVADIADIVSMSDGISTMHKVFEGMTYATFALDLIDCVFDFTFVAELGKNPETVKHAVWLGVCTTIALFLEVVVKVSIRKKKMADTKGAKGIGTFDMNNKQARAEFMLTCALMELTIFFVEDASTLFVWWETGLYFDNGADASSLSKANLITTVVSAVLAMCVLVYALYRAISQGGCDKEAVIVSTPCAVIVGVFIFWAWFALQIILDGGSKGCLGACQAKYELEVPGAAFNASAAFPGGSGSEEVLGSYADDKGLNRSVVGLYVVGWFLAVIGGLWNVYVAYFWQPRVMA